MRFQFTTRDLLWAMVLCALLCCILFREPRLPEGWKRGPMPPGTYGWGAVVPTWSTSSDGFYFADFAGDRVDIIGYNGQAATRLKPDQVRFYNNDLRLPPTDKQAAKSGRRGGR